MAYLEQNSTTKCCYLTTQHPSCCCFMLYSCMYLWNGNWSPNYFMENRIVLSHMSIHTHVYMYTLYKCVHAYIDSVQFSHSFMSDSLQPYGPQHARPPCPSPTSGVYSNLYPLSWWCHPTISSSVISFSSRLQSFPASRVFPRSFPMSQFFAWGGQSIGVSASTAVLPMNIQDLL